MLSFLFMIVRFVRGIIKGFQDPEFKGLFYFVISLLVVGVTFYHYAEGWRVLDALYFSVATLTTIGYGDFTPKTDMGKMFTIIYVFVGVGTLLGFLNLVSHHAGENDPIHRLIVGSRRTSESETEREEKK
jgi:hypothetical protein